MFEPNVGMWHNAIHMFRHLHLRRYGLQRKYPQRLILLSFDYDFLLDRNVQQMLYQTIDKYNSIIHIT